jgi:hypothetical protein
MRKLTTHEAFANLSAAWRSLVSTAVHEGILKYIFLVWLACVVWCGIFALAGCGGNGGTSGDAVNEARKPKLQLAWDPSPGAESYRVHIMRANGRTRAHATNVPCWEGTDPHAVLAWVTALRGDMESAPSNELELPCR